MTLTLEMVKAAYYQATNLQKDPKYIIQRLYEELVTGMAAKSPPPRPSESEEIPLSHTPPIS